ncbi:MAG: hypothetical protein M3O62_08750 [Pseudomonadota bacterium]|nr:hypothetical protein [Pseudomonadota bacterium]
MARIALTWELGVGSGYVATMAAIARAARAQGHECIFMVRDLAVAAPHLGPDLGDLVQAPIGATPPHQQVKVQTSYASLLHNCGFASSTVLRARLRSWQALYSRFAVDCVMSRHSPTAVLAARLMQLPLLRYGQGFSEPPEQSPWPSFRPDLQIPESALLQNEDHLLGVMNQAIGELGGKTLSAPANLVRGTPLALLTYPELDRYPRPAGTRYLGMPEISYGAEPEWPAGNGPRLFVSLHSVRQLDQWLPLLNPLKARCLVRLFHGSASGLSKAEHIRIFDDPPINFDRAAETADAILCYGSHNLANVGLLKGKPIGVIANTPDQLMMGVTVQKLGMGLLMSTNPDAGTPAMIERLLTDASLRQTTMAFAERYANWNRDTIPQRLLDAALAAQPSGF